MRYLSFKRPDGTPTFGRLAGDRVFDLGTPGEASWLRDAIAGGALGALTDGQAYALDSVDLLPVIPNPGKILCIGLNYASHIAEMGRENKGYPAVFTRWADTLVAHGAPLIRPRDGHEFDYEGELAVIIGKGGRHIPQAEALDRIAGYAVFHDASLRDWQRHNSQFTPGKNFPGTGGFGPALVTPDEIDDLGVQRVQTRLNDALMQDQPVSDLIHDVPALIAYCSSFTELRPGDVIATGTPGGVGLGRTPTVFMKAGDRVEVSIGVIGTLTNTVIDEA
ncbi:fumarylacetoacetate hydrolase family protein [Caenibius tardaugens NBRC 16725]|uniref:Fumarylacetoacetate hydrolase family protein n=1 Tax=Caenibius tardaugens NBRC 16725 TaxID=1219035 RepID=U2ZQS7_9SPHN|nr:fumarylacetoacetate hydrolase family protein [Caenibius tardaugens]AZI37043.1 FAA hydrolase family protein [Caenibius tardaugens NBRC 16725]GAD47729.1 fumarylacetoacetate hydrolase family protein [Caenibius tardaugens NBRC 16725]